MAPCTSSQMEPPSAIMILKSSSTWAASAEACGGNTSGVASAMIRPPTTSSTKATTIQTTVKRLLELSDWFMRCGLSGAVLPARPRRGVRIVLYYTSSAAAQRERVPVQRGRRPA